MSVQREGIELQAP